MRRAVLAIPCIAAVLIGACAGATTDSTASDRERIYIRKGAPFTTEYDYSLETETVADTCYTDEVTFAVDAGYTSVTDVADEPETDAKTEAVTEAETSAAVCAWTDLDETYAVFIAKTLYGECRACSETEIAAVAWCILNRVDGTERYFPDDIVAVITQPKQFLGYSEANPVTDDLMKIARDVLCRWYAEKRGTEDVGRVLPKEYKFFTGDGKHNYFTTEWRGGTVWDWSFASPYMD